MTDDEFSLPDFNNTEIAFAGKSNRQLREAYLVFRMFGIQSLIYLGTKIIVVGLKLNLPITWIVKYTIFKQFCGGVSIEDCDEVVNSMNKYKVGSILDYSVEACEEEGDLDSVASEIIRTIEKTSKHNGNRCSVFKTSGIISLNLLYQVSSGRSLSTEAQELWSKGKERLGYICKTAYENNVSLLIDAEESWIQPAIDKLAEQMMAKYNTQSVIIYNTLQMYRHDRLEYLKNWYESASKNYKLGVKLVRGAYMEKEREQAKQQGYISPIQPDKESTDRDFDEALIFCLNRIDDVAVFIGTHNEDSTLKAVKFMKQAGIQTDHPHVLFSQLYGMSDHISFNLGHHGYLVAKYVPYGPIKSVLPYLFRRAEENTSIKGHAGRELQLLSKELSRRNF